MLNSPMNPSFLQVFNAQDWYWYVGGDTTKIYSSKRNAYVTENDQTFWDWANRGNVPINVENESDIWYHAKEFMPAWLYDTETDTFSQPQANQYHPAQLSNYSELRRFETENSGMTAEGIPIRTDERTKQLITMGRDAAEAAPETFQTRLVRSDGKPHPDPVDAATMLAVSNDLNQFVFSVLEKYAELDPQIADGTVTTLQQIDDAYAAVPREL